MEVTGEGFAAMGGEVRCQFNPTLSTAATLVNSTTLRCITPAANGTSQDCAGESLEVSLLAGLQTKNYVGLRRIATPAVMSVRPDRGFYASPLWVQVTGYGFLQAATLACRFLSHGRPPLTVTGDENVRFVSNTAVECRQPAVPTGFPVPSYLEVSVDGQVFSQSLIPFDIVGVPVVLQLEPTAIEAHPCSVPRPQPAALLYK